MTASGPPSSPSPEESDLFSPRFGDDGLIPAIAQDAATGAVLMLAWMNREALERTIETGEAHYWSRSRQSLWRKGGTSGEVQKVVEVLADCDQDAILLRVEVMGRGASCHTGRKSCFYRALDRHGRKLLWRNAERLFDPASVYGDKDASIKA